MPPEVLRALDHRLGDLVEQGLARSPTLRALQAHLQQSQVIIYLEWSSRLPANLVGRTRIMGAGGGYRYLSVQLDDRLSKLDELAVLGHELQHAVEIADDPGVVDEASLAGLYRRIGSEASSGMASLWFETQEAIDAGRRVHSELAGAFW